MGHKVTLIWFYVVTLRLTRASMSLAITENKDCDWGIGMDWNFDQI